MRTAFHTRRGLLAALVLAAVVAQAVVLGLASAQLAPPPPTPVPPGGSRSPFPSRLHTPSDATSRPDVAAGSVLLADIDTGQVMFAKAPAVRRPIASVTKIMTAVVVLERTEPSDVVTVDPAAVFDNDDFGASSTLGLRAGERIEVIDLLYALMLQSANDAALALAIHVSGSVRAFLDDMNARAKELGMRDTTFFSPNGLDDRGRSTALDLLALIRTAYEMPPFERIVSTRFRTIPAPAGRPPRRIQNRNVLLWLYPGAIGAKTGSTARAGYCLVGAAERQGRRLATVVLGAPGEAFSEAAALLNHGFEAFEPRSFVRSGEPIGAVDIRGGTVTVIAGADLEALVPTSELDRVKEHIVVDPDAVFPPSRGERVATLRITLPGVTVGRVPLVVSDVPPPPPAGDGPWWARAATAVGRGAANFLGGLLG